MRRIFELMLLMFVSLVGHSQLPREISVDHTSPCDSNKIEFIDFKGNLIKSNFPNVIYIGAYSLDLDVLCYDDIKNLLQPQYRFGYYHSFDSRTKYCLQCRENKIEIIDSTDLNLDGKKELFLLRNWSCSATPPDMGPYGEGGLQLEISKLEVWDIYSDTKIFEVKNQLFRQAAVSTSVVVSASCEMDVNVNLQGDIILSNQRGDLLGTAPDLGIYRYDQATKTYQLAPHKNDQDINVWDENSLKERALAHLDSSQWNESLFQQDIETHAKYAEAFDQYPLNNYPFPVADYDYAVYSNPFTARSGSYIFKGVQIGEYENPDSDSITTQLTLLVLTNDDLLEPETFVDSRNFPYLTAEGNFRLPQQTLKWVFQAAPDGYSSLFLSMKLFDLRFGETIVIYPQKDLSFLYEQIDDSPDNYSKFEEYVEKIMTNKNQLARLQQVK